MALVALSLRRVRPDRQGQALRHPCISRPSIGELGWSGSTLFNIRLTPSAQAPSIDQSWHQAPTPADENTSGVERLQRADGFEFLTASTTAWTATRSPPFRMSITVGPLMPNDFLDGVERLAGRSPSGTLAPLTTESSAMIATQAPPLPVRTPRRRDKLRAWWAKSDFSSPLTLSVGQSTMSTITGDARRARFPPRPMATISTF